MLGALGRFVAGESTVDEALGEAIAVALDAVPAAAMAGVTLAGERNEAKTQVSTSPRARAVDEAQYGDGVGPCLDAWREQREVYVVDVRDVATAYPSFAATAEQVGIRSTVSLPLVVGEHAVGALNLYADEAGAFDDAARRVASDVCTVAATVLAIVARHGEAVDANLQLRQAMESRAAIEQAKGILMATMRCTPDDAFDILRQQSQSENRKLREIAEELVARHSGR